jgi:hypothetical protein
MMSTTKFALGFALSLVTGTTVLSQPPSEPTAAWFGQCLRCEWDPWGGPAFCAVASGTGWWGCLAVGYKCTQGGNPCGKKPGGGVPVTPLPPPDDLAGG